MSAPILELQELTVTFPGKTGRFAVVRDLNFQINKGETLCLVGESGCGKSMTALAIMGLIPEAGQVTAQALRLNNENLLGLSEKQLAKFRGKAMGMIFQEPMTSLNPVLRLGLQVAEPLLIHKDLSKAEAKIKVLDLLHKVGLSDPERRYNEYPHELSGGMRQRVMIAMALACDPVLLLADEPTTALDVTIQGQILNLLKNEARQRGMGMLLITHDLGVVAQSADWVGVMYAGSLVEYMVAAKLFTTSKHPYTLGLMESAPSLEQVALRLPTIAGTVPSLQNLPAGCAFQPRCPRAFGKCGEEPPLVKVSDNQFVRCWLALT